MSEAEIREQAQVVANLRIGLASTKDTINELRDEFNTEHEGLIQWGKDKATALEEAESKLKDMAIAAFESDPTNKKPGPGVSIQDTTGYGFDPVEALKWATEHKICLRLDETGYKALIKQKAAPGQVLPGRRAVLATDMAKALSNG